MKFHSLHQLILLFALACGVRPTDMIMSKVSIVEAAGGAASSHNRAGLGSRSFALGIPRAWQLALQVSV